MWEDFLVMRSSEGRWERSCVAVFCCKHGGMLSEVLKLKVKYTFGRRETACMCL